MSLWKLTLGDALRILREAQPSVPISSDCRQVSGPLGGSRAYRPPSPAALLSLNLH